MSMALLPRLRTSFLTRIIMSFFALSLVILIGVVRFSTSSLFRELEFLEIRYNAFVVEKFVDGVNELLDGADALFQGVYLEDFMGYTLDNLMGRGAEDMPPHQRRSLVTDKLELMNLMYPTVSEVVLVDSVRHESYSSTLQVGRSVRLDYDFFVDPIVLDLEVEGLQRRVFPPYRPPFIYSSTDEVSHEVIVIARNVFDGRVMDLSRPIGALVFTLDPNRFQEILDGIDPQHQGRMLIRATDSLEPVFDNWPTRPFPDNYQVVTASRLSWSELELVHIPSDEQRKSLHRKSRLLTLAIVGVSAVALLAFVSLSSRMVARRLVPLSRAMERIQNGDFETRIELKHHDEFTRIEETYNAMSSTLDDFIDRAYKAELQSHKSQLKLLRQQFNPHFMYNTLQSIQMKALINRNIETAEMVQILGELFRWVLKDDAEVSLSEEILYLEKYVSLQNHRFPVSLDLILDIPDDLLNERVPKMVFQPLLENSIAHGLAERGGQVRLSARREGAIIVFQIHDNGKGMSDTRRKEILDSLTFTGEAPEEHIGLWNLNSRVAQYYGSDRYGIVNVVSSPEGTTVTLQLPAGERNAQTPHS